MYFLSSSTHTIIIGGGIIGVSTAYYLARRGTRVTLIDRGAFDTNASTGNAGIIALGHAPMPRPGMIRQTLRMLFNSVNPLYIPPRYDLDLIRWMWNFRKACTQSHFEHSMRILAQLGRLAGETFDTLVCEESIACEYHKTGWMDVFRTESRFTQGRGEAELIRSYGYNVQILTGEELRKHDPAFLPSVLGAVHYTDSRFANPGMFLRELADRAIKHGAQLRTNTEVQSIHTSTDHFTSIQLSTGERIEGDTLILAAGSWTTQLARSIGINIPMQPGKGYHIMLSQPDPCVKTTSVLAETFVAATPIADGLRLAGTVELSGINHRMVQKRLDMLRIGARQYLHDIDNCATQSTWCGLRPCTADGLPVIGWAPQFENIYIATGHAMMGFALGPITGKLVSEAILNRDTKRTDFDLAPLSPSRYV